MNGEKKNEWWKQNEWWKKMNGGNKMNGCWRGIDFADVAFWNLKIMHVTSILLL